MRSMGTRCVSTPTPTRVDIDPRLAGRGLVATAGKRRALFARRSRRSSSRRARVPKGSTIAVTDHGPGSTRRARSPVRALLPRPRARNRPHRAPAWDSPLRAGCSRRSADGCGPRMPGRRRAIFDRRFPGRSRSPRARPDMPPRILVVDDEPNILGDPGAAAALRGYEVFTAMNGRAAIETIDRDKPDLIVLDLGLPDIDGVEVCRQIRESLECADRRAVGARRGSRQGARARCRRRRLRHQAVRRRGAAGAHSRRPAALRRAGPASSRSCAATW